MKTIDIVEGFNKFFEKLYPNRGYFVSKLTIEQNKNVKLIKTYNLELWYVNGRYKDKAIYIEKSVRVPDNMDESIIKDMNIELSRLMFKNYSKLLEYGV